ncbi:hypothetical protein PS619_03458 [Pseudomonas fluorescens]|nr:hypothetical protein PS619_03458 [Pseudomonas fluorescens]VVN28583.1 hypothetical protein PS681_04714 [Pseudomonas fluorescens]VVN54983.1 hypothetical protein PS684_01900 [Pseudomonas fluorescens]
MNELFQRFLSEELNEGARELLRTGVLSAQEPGAVTFIREFNFNLFDVLIDFETRVVVVQDVLLPETDPGSVMSLDEFRSLCGI